MIKVALILFLCFSMLDCSGQKKEGMTELEDPISSGTPFVLKRNDMFLDVSSKLEVQEIKGIVGLAVFIDSTENLIGFNILKLTLESSNGANVNFTSNLGFNKPYQKEDYSMEVQQFYSLIQEYINELEFERDKNVPLKAINEMSFIARLK